MPTHRSSIPPRAALTGAATVTTVGLLLSACGTPTTPVAAPGAGSSSTPAATSSAGSNEREVASISPRIVVSHADGLTTLDAATGRVVDETSHPGFLRLNNAGDGRHVMVSDSDVFRVYDAGIEAQRHGDHHHYREFTPGLTDVTYDAKHAGHVVLHAGLTTLFADGTGAIQILSSGDIAKASAAIRHAKTDAPHHGVALELSDGSLLTTQGTQEARSTVQVRRGDTVLAQTSDCPGVHGEAVAAPTRGTKGTKGAKSTDVVVFGCEDGPVVLRDGAFHKVPVKDAYARSGNLAGSHTSPIVLGDYKVKKKTDENTEPEHPTRVALIDTRADRLDLVDLKSPYWFRSLARGPKGEGIVLTYDGALKIVDPTSKAVTASIPVISSWTEKKDWQEPGPAVKVAGTNAYVTDAEQKTLSVIDLTTRAVIRKFDLPHTPVEFAVVAGSPEAPRADATGHEGHSH